MNNELSTLLQILDDSDQMIQVCDVETHSMLYANAPMLKAAAHSDIPYLGQKCHKYLMDSDVPCSFCPYNSMDNSEQIVKDVEDVASEVDFCFSAVDMSKDEIKAIEEEYAKTETPVVSNNSAHRWTPDVPMIIRQETSQPQYAARRVAWHRDHLF